MLELKYVFGSRSSNSKLTAIYSIYYILKTKVDYLCTLILLLGLRNGSSNIFDLRTKHACERIQ